MKTLNNDKKRRNNINITGNHNSGFINTSRDKCRYTSRRKWSYK